MFCMIENIKINQDILVRINSFNAISVKHIQWNFIGIFGNNEKLENNIFWNIWNSSYNYVRVNSYLIITKIHYINYINILIILLY